jgi:hypothetical protein
MDVHLNTFLVGWGQFFETLRYRVRRARLPAGKTLKAIRNANLPLRMFPVKGRLDKYNAPFGVLWLGSKQRAGGNSPFRFGLRGLMKVRRTG